MRPRGLGRKEEGRHWELRDPKFLLKDLETLGRLRKIKEWGALMRENQETGYKPQINQGRIRSQVNTEWKGYIYLFYEKKSFISIFKYRNVYPSESQTESTQATILRVWITVNNNFWVRNVVNSQ